LQRFYNLNFSITKERLRLRVFRLLNQHSLARIAGLKKAAFE